jgi:hypothetical protein
MPLLVGGIKSIAVSADLLGHLVCGTASANTGVGVGVVDLLT